MLIRDTVSGIQAGIVIALGGSVFLACDNRYVGAVLFSVALLCICLKQYSLFTGKIGFIPEKHGKRELSVLLLGLLGNAVGTAVCGFLIRTALPKLGETAAALCTLKLAQTPVQALIRAAFCGILMYLAVGIYRDKNTVVGILFCIPVFILSGFEHSIADMFYFAASGIVSGQAALYLLLIVVGNAAGAVVLPLLQRLGKGEPVHVG